jgi:hypothetical protein
LVPANAGEEIPVNPKTERAAVARIATTRLVSLDIGFFLELDIFSSKLRFLALENNPRPPTTHRAVPTGCE